VLELIQRSTAYLAQKGVDSPRLQSELLLAYVLRIPRLNLYLNFDRTLVLSELDAMRDLVKRRGQREPLQHLLGTACFCGLELNVNREVLAPRPETEVLAECAWQFLNGPPVPFTTAPCVLDFGTGSGCLAITLAMKCPQARIVALDISPEAISVAQANAARHDVVQRIEFVAGDGLGALPEVIRFDLIVTNPPYIPSVQIETLMPEVRNFDPHIALDGGPDGLKFYRRLASEAGRWLQPDGRLMMEFGDGQSVALTRIFIPPTWTVLGIEPDLSGRPRVLTAGRNSGP
jgi:release factor glutamine methyltransferase